MAPNAFGALAGGEAKSRNNGRARPASLDFDIVVGPLFAVRLTNLREVIFSHGFTTKVKKILPKVSRCRTPARVRLGQSGRFPIRSVGRRLRRLQLLRRRFALCSSLASLH